MSDNGDLPRGVYKAPFTVERPEKVSQTFLAHMDRCAYSALLYLHVKDRAQSPPLVRGELFHDFMEQATNMLIEQGEPEMPPEVAKDLIQALIEERTDLVLPVGEQDALRLMAWNWGAATYLDLEAIIGCELMLELAIGNWIVRGKIDRLERFGSEIHVRDAKTSLAVPSQEDFEAQYQLPFYALIAAKGTPEDSDTVLGKGASGFHLINEFPRYRTAEGPLVTRSTYIDQAQLHDFERTVRAGLAKLEHGLETGEWAASPGAHCVRCPASALCPIPLEARGEFVIGTAGDAAEVAERVLLGEDAVKSDKAALKAWVDEHGSVQVGDIEFNYSFSESERADKPAIKAALEAAGLDPDDYFKKSPSTRFGKAKVKA